MARPEGLAVLGAFHPGPADGAPAGCGTLVLLGPDGPEFWAVFQAAPESRDGAPDPLNRWSERVIGGLAAALRRRGRSFRSAGRPGCPSPPGRGGAARPGSRRWGCSCMRGSGSSSPIAARWRSLRGSRCPTPPARPCDTCAAPCLGACPAGALGGAATISPPATAGSTPRRAATAWRGAAPCGGPARWGRGLRPEAQSAFHMTAFHGRQGHATADPDAPRQVELGRSRPARPRPAAEQARPAQRRAGRRLAEAEGLPAASTRWSRSRGGRRRPGPAWSPPPAPRRRPICRSSTTRRPTRCSPYSGGAGGGARPAARPPAGHRRLRAAAARGAAGGRRLRQVPDRRHGRHRLRRPRLAGGRWESGRLADFVVPRTLT